MSTRSDGFTLFDALISLVILSLCLTALYKLQWSTQRSRTIIHSSNMALQLARQQLELWQQPYNLSQYAQLSGGSDQISSNHVRFKRTWQVTELQRPDLKQITLTISWQQYNQNHAIDVMATIIRPVSRNRP